MNRDEASTNDLLRELLDLWEDLARFLKGEGAEPEPEPEPPVGPAPSDPTG